MANKNLVLITSALHTRFGKFSKDQRKTQLIQSIASVEAIPNTHVIVGDAGEQAWEESDIAEIMGSRDSIEVFSFADHPVIQNLKASKSWDLVKNLGEVLIINSISRLLLEREQIYSRIFKLSGRYWLNEKFTLQAHLEPKFVFARARSSQFSSDVTLGVNKQRSTRLYSMPCELLPSYNELTVKMFNLMRHGPTRGFYLDVEHLFYLLLPSQLVREVEPIGVSGFLAPTGGLIHD